MLFDLSQDAVLSLTPPQLHHCLVASIHNCLTWTLCIPNSILASSKTRLHSAHSGHSTPPHMAVSEVLEAFKLIVLGQANNSRVFDFLLTRENIPHSAVINSDNDDHDDEIQELPDPESAVTRESQVSLLDQFWINCR